MTLLADWELVQSYLEFVHQRTGREGYTQDTFSTTSLLHNLYLFFLPSLAADSVREPHWAGRAHPSQAACRRSPGRVS
jgi:hypothetical protein